MKKVLSIVAVSAFMLTAGSALAGGPGKRMMDIPAGCNEECQAQLDELQAGQAQQNELLNAHSAEIEALKNREDLYNPFYVRGAFKFGWGSQNASSAMTGLGHWDWTSTSSSGRTIRHTDRTHYIDNETYFGGQGAIGKYIFNNFRVELEYAYQHADLDNDNYDGDVGLHTVMVNAFYEIPITDMFGLYGVVGGGYGNFSIDASRRGESRASVERNQARWREYERYPGGWLGSSSDVFAYKIGAGMSIFFLESRALALDIGYEYLGTTDGHFRTGYNNGMGEGEVDISSIHSHNVVTSLRFMF